MIAEPPAVLELMRHDPNLAVDDALVESLPHLDSALVAVALDLLIERNNERALAGVVGRFNSYPPLLQSAIESRLNGLFTGVRLACTAGGNEHRLSAIALIRRTSDGRLFYLLAEALIAASPDVRTAAADALCDLAQRVTSPTSTEVASAPVAGDQLGEALALAVTRWELHHQTDVLRAALWMWEWTIGELESTSAKGPRLIRAIVNMISGTVDARLAAFLLRALAMEPLRTVAAKTIAGSEDPELIAGLGRASWILADQDVQRGAKWVHDLKCFAPGADVLTRLPASEGLGLIRLLTASGVAHARKMTLFREVINTGGPELLDGIVGQLVHDASDDSTALLTALADRSESPVGRIAQRELDRRFGIKQRKRKAGSAPVDPAPALAPGMDAGDASLVASLSSANPLDRVGALRTLRTRQEVAPFSDWVLRLTHDADAIVRSAAVALLPKLSAHARLRAAREALADRDARVEANAIEAAEQLGLSDRKRLVEEKLKSPDNRVRANAVVALLKTELSDAGDALLTMLDSPSRAHRISALWVIERLQLSSLTRRLVTLRETDEDTAVRRRAERVLGMLGSPAMAHVTADSLDPRSPEGAL